MEDGPPRNLAAILYTDAAGNLRIALNAVFPSGAAANPIFTLLALVLLIMDRHGLTAG